MLMNQRSSDYIVSNFINELQYVALQLMVAKHLGITPGKFTHVSENVQIYDRHIEQAKKLISRKSVECNPKLVLYVPDGTCFYGIRFEDFKIVDFPIDKIKEQNPQQQFDLGI
jgi:thymidylate synthase